MILLILLVLTLTVTALFIDSNTRIVATEYELNYLNLPESFDGYRIVVLADIHGASFGKDNERLVTQVMEAKPDLIAIVGDFIDHNTGAAVEKQLEIAEALVERLVTISPVYYVTGNHEWDKSLGGPWELLSILDKHGVNVLRNRFTRLEAGGSSIILAGTDDPNGPADMMKPDELVARIRNADNAADGGTGASTGTGDNAVGGSFIVMLEHRNHNLELYSGLGVDLVLCGHSHGGYIRLPFTDGLIGPMRDWFPTFTSGVYTMGGTTMVVSRGLGNHIGVPRFLNNPHIVVAVLRNSEFGIRNSELS